MDKINNINRREFLEIFGVCSCGIALAACGQLHLLLKEDS